MRSEVSLLCLVLFAFFIFIQLVYYFYFFARLAFYRGVEKHNTISSSNFPISIIICAHNELHKLKKYLPKILEQDYASQGTYLYEVLVVDDNSTDDSLYYLQELKLLYPHLNILSLSQESQQMRGKKFPLSMGIKQAKYEHILLSDADCEPASKYWLQFMAQAFSTKNEIVLGYSPFFTEKHKLNATIRFENFYTAFQYLSFALAKIPYMGVGRNLAYHRNLFFKNKGFSSHQRYLSGDDDVFINQVATKNNTTVMLHPDSFVYSEAKQNKEDWNIQKKRHLSVGHLYKTKHKILLGLLAFSHAYIYVGWVGLVFHKFYLLIALALFLFRYIVVFTIQALSMKKLKQNDLIPSILLYDIWLPFYYLSKLPILFLNKKNLQWK